MKLLIVDDEPDVVEVVRLTFSLQWQGCDLATASDGETALALFEEEQPDVVILDIGLPDMSGFDVCRKLREVSDVPIVMLTVRGEEMSKIKGLELGADDYITKPFSPLELVARIKAIMRRVDALPQAAFAPAFNSGHLTVNVATRTVTVRGEPVRLTPTEYTLLFHLVHNAGRIMPYGTLLTKVWGREYRDDLDCLKVHVARLRNKIEDDARDAKYIVNERGIGYRFIKMPQ